MPFSEFEQHQQGSVPARPRSKKYSLYEISLNDSVGCYGSPRSSGELKHYDLGAAASFNRDSGISTSSHELNNLNAAAGQAQTPSHHHHHYHQPITTVVPVGVPPPPTLDEFNISFNGNGATTPRGHQKTNSNPEAYNFTTIQDHKMNSINTSMNKLSNGQSAPPPPIPPKSASLQHQHSVPLATAAHHTHVRNQSLNLSQNSSSDGDGISLNDISPAPPPQFNDNFSDDNSFSGDECCESSGLPPETAGYCVPRIQSSGATNSLGRRSVNNGEELGTSPPTMATGVTMVPLRHDDDEEEIFY